MMKSTTQHAPSLSWCVFGIIAVPFLSNIVEAPLSYITIFLGIFASVAFLIVTIILHHNEQGIGPWVLISFALYFLTLSEIARKLLQRTDIHDMFFTAAMVLLFIVAVIKYWDTMEYTE